MVDADRRPRPSRARTGAARAAGVLGVLAAALPAGAQSDAAARRIGILVPGRPVAEAAGAPEALIQALRERGWAEGQNLTVERRSAQGGRDRLPRLAPELAGPGVEVFVTVGPAATHAAKVARVPQPVVFAAVAAPVESGFVAGLGRPGGDFTGSAFDLPPVEYARLPALLKEATPHVFRHGVLWDPTSQQRNPTVTRALLEGAYEEARIVGLELPRALLERTEAIDP